MKRDEEAEEDLVEALKFAPEDAGIKKEKVAVASRRQEKIKKQRAAYSRMFGGATAAKSEAAPSGNGETAAAAPSDEAAPAS